MLLYNPFYLFDTGFQLSFLAFSWKGLLIYFLAAIIIPMEPM